MALGKTAGESEGPKKSGGRTSKTYLEKDGLKKRNPETNVHFTQTVSAFKIVLLWLFAACGDGEVETTEHCRLGIAYGWQQTLSV